MVAISKDAYCNCMLVFCATGMLCFYFETWMCHLIWAGHEEYPFLTTFNVWQLTDEKSFSTPPLHSKWCCLVIPYLCFFVFVFQNPLSAFTDPLNLIHFHLARIKWQVSFSKKLFHKCDANMVLVCIVDPIIPRRIVDDNGGLKYDCNFPTLNPCLQFTALASIPEGQKYYAYLWDRASYVYTVYCIFLLTFKIKWILKYFGTFWNSQIRARYSRFYLTRVR